MQHCDVLVVGGGPAGSTCAWKLKQAGLNVLLIDRQQFPRDKTCAGWLTPPIIDSLELDVRDYAADNVFQPITGFHTGVIDGRSVAVTYGEEVSYGIRRREFDHYLLTRAAVPMRLGEPLKTLSRSYGTWLANDEIEANVVVAAGGHFCPVTRMYGEREMRPGEVVCAQEVEFLADDDLLENSTVSGDAPHLYFCADLNGYGWCFRKGQYLNIGLGRLGSEHLADHVADFVRFLQDRGIVRGTVPDRFHGHAYRLYEQAEPKLFDERLLFIGDAAGLAYPQSGEGIRPAVESALLAADVLVGANGDYSAGNLARYRRLLTDRLGTPRRSSVSGWLPGGWSQRLARFLLSNRWFDRRVVLDRWFLHVGQGALTSAIGQ